MNPAVSGAAVDKRSLAERLKDSTDTANAMYHRLQELAYLTDALIDQSHALRGAMCHGLIDRHLQQHRHCQRLLKVVQRTAESSEQQNNRGQNVINDADNNR